MRGRIFNLDRQNNRAKVDTRNDQYGVLTVYFSGRIPDNVCDDCTIEFDVILSQNGNYYAKYCHTIERNQAIYNTENRTQWYVHGETLENDFICECVPLIGRNIRRNPEKDIDPTVIDLMDYTDTPEGEPCDLKTQNTPFFTAGKYCYQREGRRINYDPSYTVTFNRKDYERYRELYPDCRIYFWVQWQQQSGYGINIENVSGVWVAEFRVLSDRIEGNNVYLHAYLNRRTDDHNAQDSYLFDLNDNTVFKRLLY